MNHVRLKEMRKACGLTQDALAPKIGVQRAVISKYENGSVSPSIEQLSKIADALKVSVSELLYDGVIRIDTSKHKHPKDMSQEELSEYLKEYPQLIEKLGKSLMEIDDALLNFHVGDDALLLHYYQKLNHYGRKEAIKRVRELTLLQEYNDQ